MATKPRPRAPETAIGRPGGAGTDPDALGLGVALIRTASGRGVTLPRAVSRLSPPAIELMADMQDVALRRAELDEQLAEMVAHARGHGASWAAVAWSVGTTAEGARVRYRDVAPFED